MTCITTPPLIYGSAGATPQITAAERQVRALSLPAALDDVDLDDPAGWWEGLPVERRRHYVRELLDIVILPTGRTGRRPFDPDSVTVTPRW